MLDNRYLRQRIPVVYDSHQNTCSYRFPWKPSRHATVLYAGHQHMQHEKNTIYSHWHPNSAQPIHDAASCRWCVLHINVVLLALIPWNPKQTNTHKFVLQINAAIEMRWKWHVGCRDVGKKRWGWPDFSWAADLLPLCSPFSAVLDKWHGLKLT